MILSMCAESIILSVRMIAMERGSSGGQQQQRNERRDSRAIATGDDVLAVQDDCC